MLGFRASRFRGFGVVFVVFLVLGFRASGLRGFGVLLFLFFFLGGGLRVLRIWGFRVLRFWGFRVEGFRVSFSVLHLRVFGFLDF